MRSHAIAFALVMALMTMLLRMPTPALAGPSGFRLPFVGYTTITTGPGCSDTHGAGNSSARSYEAIDFDMDAGTPVFAAADGEVVADGDNGDGYGKRLVIRHGDYFALYGHLDSYTKRDGDMVRQGEKIANAGTTGQSSGEHLHFEVYNLQERPVSIRDLPGMALRECGGSAIGPAVEISLESRNFPGHYVRHQDFRGKITSISTGLDRDDASFRLVPGLSGGARTVSLESINYPGHYLRHQGFELKLHPMENTDLFQKDATFTIERGRIEATETGISFRSVNYPDRYIRHRNFLLYLEGGDDPLAKKDATFQITLSARSTAPALPPPSAPPTPAPMPAPAPLACGQITGWKGEYWRNAGLSGAPDLCRNETAVDFNWASGSPAPQIPSDNFSARWTRRIPFEPGRYRFILAGDDGFSLRVDGATVIDKWIYQPRTEHSGEIDISGGEHEIRVEYFEAGGDASLSLRWERVSAAVPAPSIDTGRLYRIVSVHSGKALDVAGASRDDGAIIHQWQYAGGANQQWRLEVTGDGYYRIISVHSGKCLDIAGASTRDGEAVIQSSCHDGDNQRWRLISAGSGVVIQARHSAKVLDVVDWGTNNGAKIAQWTRHDGANQQWRLEALP